MKEAPLHKALPIVAMAVGDKHGIKVHVGGDVACTNGKQIFIPSLPEGKEARVLARGFIDHEAAHVRYTNFQVPMDSLTNSLEDVRIEGRIGEKFPGSKKNLKDLVSHLANSGMIQVSPQDPAVDVIGKYANLTMRRDRLGQDLEGLAGEAEQVFEARFGAKAKKWADNVLSKKLTSTKKAQDMAQELYKLVGQNQQGQDQQGQSQQGDGQDSQSDAESGESEQDESGQDGQSAADSGEDEQSDDGQAGSGDYEEGSDEGSNDGQSLGSSNSNDASDDASGNASDEEQSGESGGSNSSGTDDDDEADEEANDSSGDGSGEGSGDDSQAGSEFSASGSDESGSDTSGDSQDSQAGQNGSGQTGSDNPKDGSFQGLGEILREELNAQGQQGDNVGPGVIAEKSVSEATSRVPEPHLPFSPERAGRESVKLRRRLKGLLEAKHRRGEHTCRSGRNFAKKDLHRLATKDTRVFSRKIERQAPNTAIHVLLDTSGSMQGIELIQTLEAGYAIGKALDKIQHAQYAISGFPGKSGDNYVDRVKSFEEKLDHTRFSLTADNTTPTAEAMWYAVSTLAPRREERKIVFVVTDGRPNDWDAVIQMDTWLRRREVEVVGIGINLPLVQELFRDSLIIQRLKELTPALFKALEKKL